MKQTNKIEAQAADWLAQLTRASLGEKERAAFDDWLAADPKHLAAYGRLEAAWQRLDRLQSLGPQAGAPGLPSSQWQRTKAFTRRMLASFSL